MAVAVCPQRLCQLFLEDLLDRFEDPPAQQRLNVLAQAEHLRLRRW
jgi:hypothetical protein